MLKGHQDILWLTGQVFLSRDFVKEAEEKGLDAIFAACPYGDLTESEKTTFKAAFASKSGSTQICGVKKLAGGHSPRL